MQRNRTDKGGCRNDIVSFVTERADGWRWANSGKVLQVDQRPLFERLSIRGILNKLIIRRINRISYRPIITRCFIKRFPLAVCPD